MRLIAKSYIKKNKPKSLRYKVFSDIVEDIQEKKKQILNNILKNNKETLHELAENLQEQAKAESKKGVKQKSYADKNEKTDIELKPVNDLSTEEGLKAFANNVAELYLLISKSSKNEKDSATGDAKKTYADEDNVEVVDFDTALAEIAENSGKNLAQLGQLEFINSVVAAEEVVDENGENANSKASKKLRRYFAENNVAGISKEILENEKVQKLMKFIDEQVKKKKERSKFFSIISKISDVVGIFFSVIGGLGILASASGLFLKESGHGLHILSELLKSRSSDILLSLSSILFAVGKSTELTAYAYKIFKGGKLFVLASVFGSLVLAIAAGLTITSLLASLQKSRIEKAIEKIDLSKSECLKKNDITEVQSCLTSVITEQLTANLSELSETEEEK
jgi:hypothetical protein